ncbi:MAG: helix-turn-helix domain-containing protein [Limisphaerales bacterium]
MRSPTKLLNYLRTYRKRAGLSQDEVAFLLGCRTGAAVSRYEHFRRVPNPATILALEAIFQIPVRELFAGQFQTIEREVMRRAGRLARKLSAAPQGRPATRKLEALRKIVALSENP